MKSVLATNNAKSLKLYHEMQKEDICESEFDNYLQSGKFVGLSKVEELVIIHNQGQKMFGNLHLPGEGAPCVLLSHGLESSKDGNKWLMLSPRLYEAGFASLRFSYRGCGEGDEKSEGKFEDSTLTARISDYKAVIDFLHQVKVNLARLGVIGSSLGGMVALAAGDERIKAIVTLATPLSLLPSTKLGLT